MKFAQSVIQKAKAAAESRKVPAAKPNPISNIINNVVSKLSLSTVSSSSLGSNPAASPVSSGVTAALEQAKASGNLIMASATSPTISNSQSSQMGLFSKKPGGTFFGNFLRGVASAATGGILGSGANRIEIGQTKTNAQLQAEALAAQAEAAKQTLSNPSAIGAIVGGAAAASGSQAAGSAAGSAIWAKYKVWILAGGAAVVGLVIFLATRGRRPRKRY